MIVSLDMYFQYHNTVNADPGRIAAQVVSGIGFLGAGTIMREGTTVRGLTTAAGLWVVACVGLAVGAGMYGPAVVTTVLVLFVLIYFFRFEQRVTGMREYKAFVMVVDDRPGQVGKIGSVLGDMGVLIKNIDLTRLEEDDGLEVEVLLHVPSNVQPGEVLEQLSSIPGTRSVDRLN
jgi:putative Mg2+ transporter-C (MgtC) family protein